MLGWDKRTLNLDNEPWTEHICVHEHDQVCNSVQGARDGMWYVSLGNWPESSDAVSRLRSNHRQMSGPGSPELLLTRPLSPELTTPPHFPLSWELRLSTQIFVTAVTSSVQSSQGTNDQQEYEVVLCNLEWNSVLTIWIEVEIENDQKWTYRKDFFNYTNQIV